VASAQSLQLCNTNRDEKMDIPLPFFNTYRKFFAGTGEARAIENFNRNWKFKLDPVNDYSKLTGSGASWRTLHVPHDCSIDLPFDSTSLETVPEGF
jgi:hypothetical protein